MDGLLGLLVVVALLAAASGAALGGTAAGQRQLDHWDTITAPGNQRTELGRRAAALGRAAGWIATGSARAVRAGLGAVRSRRGGGAATASAAAGADGPDVTAGPSLATSRPTGPDAPGGAGALFDQDAPEPTDGTEVPPVGKPAASGDTGTGDFVDAADFWPTPAAVNAPPADVTPSAASATALPAGAAPSAAALPAPVSTEESPMGAEVEVSASAAISHVQFRAALRTVQNNVAALRANAASNAKALSLMAAFLEQVQMDPVVQTATLEAMMTGNQVTGAANQLQVMCGLVDATLSQRGHDSVAAVAQGLHLAGNSGYYSGQ